MRSTCIGAGLLAVALAATPATGQTPPAAPSGEAIYAARCKECHESGDERAPTPAQLAAKAPADIVTALTTGPMAPMAEGLTPEEKQAVASWLTRAAAGA
jgi:mono/diheme cytochrome c family protein